VSDVNPRGVASAQEKDLDRRLSRGAPRLSLSLRSSLVSRVGIIVKSSDRKPDEELNSPFAADTTAVRPAFRCTEPHQRAVLVAVVGLCLTGCGESGGPEQSEDERILHEYLRDHPEVQDNHEHWHLDTDRGRSGYGESFLTFHRAVIGKHDAWRLEHGYSAVTPWDPSESIPRDADHHGRLTSDPSAVDPLCRTPEWLRLDGNGVRNPEFGAGRLGDFTSSDQLGRAIDSLVKPNWHARVHATVGGDLASLHQFPLDPAFWRFHKFVDGIWHQWQEATATTPNP